MLKKLLLASTLVIGANANEFQKLTMVEDKTSEPVYTLFDIESEDGVLKGVIALNFTDGAYNFKLYAKETTTISKGYSDDIVFRCTNMKDEVYERNVGGSFRHVKEHTPFVTVGADGIPIFKEPRTIETGIRSQFGCKPETIEWFYGANETRDHKNPKANYQKLKLTKSQLNYAKPYSLLLDGKEVAKVQLRTISHEGYIRHKATYLNTSDKRLHIESRILAKDNRGEDIRKSSIYLNKPRDDREIGVKNGISTFKYAYPNEKDIYAKPQSYKYGEFEFFVK